MDFSEDLLRILPAPSRAKLEALLIERDAARAAYRAASDAEQQARLDLGRAESIAQHQSAMPGGIEIHPAARVVAERDGTAQAEREDREARIMAPVEAARRRLQLASDARERAAARQNGFSYLENVSAWLSRAASFGIGRLEHCPVKPLRTKDVVGEIERIRAELSALDEQWQAAETAPAPVSELKARFLSELDAIAERGRPSVDATARAGSPVNLTAALRIGQMPVALADGGTHFSLVGDAGASFFTWLMRDQIAERITAMIDAAAPAKGALTDDQRDAEFSRISARRLELERQEEALIVAAEQEGRIVQRRRDADPRAILEVVEA